MMHLIQHSDGMFAKSKILPLRFRFFPHSNIKIKVVFKFHIARNFPDYTELGIPTISPYKCEMPYVFSTVNPKALLNFYSDNRELIVYGCEAIEVRHMMYVK